MPVIISLHDEARARLMRGLEAAALAVRPTLGPAGRLVLIEGVDGRPFPGTDGLTILEELELEDPLSQLGVQLIREGARRVRQSVGDGTTTTALLTLALVKGGLQAVAAGADPVALRRGLRQAVAVALSTLRGLARPVSPDEALARVAALAAGNPGLGPWVADAFRQVGAEGLVLVERSPTGLDALQVSTGLAWDEGYVSPGMVTAPEAGEARLEHPYVLAHDRPIRHADELLIILEQARRRGRPLLVVAPDVSGEALATLLLNKERGILLAVAVRAPGDGAWRDEMLGDIALATGGHLVSERTGLALDRTPLSYLGQARRALIDARRTVLWLDEEARSRVAGRLHQLDLVLNQAVTEADRQRLRRWRAALAGQVATLRVGAPTDLAAEERQRRAEAAVAAVRSALQGGVLPGGGSAYLAAAQALTAAPPAGEERWAWHLLRRALAEPARQIAANAGYDGQAVVARLAELPAGFGFDASNGQVVDCLAAGLVDPAPVVWEALAVAASLAETVWLAEVAVAQAPEPELVGDDEDEAVPEEAEGDEEQDEAAAAERASPARQVWPRELIEQLRRD